MKNNLLVISFLTFLSVCFGTVFADPLPPEKVFHFEAKIEGSSVMIYGHTMVGYHLYKDSIKIINNHSGVLLENIIKPKGKIEYDSFSGKELEEYEGDFLMEIPFGGKGKVDVDLESQGCTQGLCYSPFVTHITIKK